MSEFVLDLDAYRKRRAPKKLELPPIAHHLLLAEVLQADLKADLTTSRTTLAGRYGLTKPRVTQLLGLLSLHETILCFIRSLGPGAPERLVTEKKLRGLVRLEPRRQLVKARQLIEGFGAYESRCVKAAG